jgi:hypothetical protein
MYTNILLYYKSNQQKKKGALVCSEQIMTTFPGICIKFQRKFDMNHQLFQVCTKTIILPAATMGGCRILVRGKYRIVIAYRI